MMKELWKKRSLVSTFAINDLMVRYRGSVLGFIWSILEPLLIFSVLYIVFTNVFRSDIENYAIYLILGIVMWNFFVRSTSMGMNSFIVKGGIVTKTFFPREILPFSSCLTALLMSVFEFVILVVFFGVFNFIPSYTVIFLPLVLGLEFILSYGVSMGLSVLNVRYRDIQYIWGVITYAGFFAVPIFYSFDVVPDKIKELLMLNPMAQIIDMSHDLVLYNKIPEMWNIGYTIIITAVVFVVGFFVFKLLESKVVEEL